MGYGVNQSLAVNDSKLDGPQETMVNSGTLSWSESKGDALSGGVNLSLTDTRSWGKFADHTLVAILGLNGLSSYRTTVYGLKVEANATLVVARESRGQTVVAPAGKGVVSYNKQNVFGVRQLNYDAKFEVLASRNNQSSNLSSPNLPNLEARYPVSYSLIQHLIYRVGMNELRLTGSLDDKYGVKNALLLLQFRAWRTIGN